MSAINRGLNRVTRRADQRSDDHLRRTFVDSGVTAAIEISDHQVLFGRRGTGKTHALRYVQGQVESQGDVAIYVDLRTVGSPEGLFAGDELPNTERSARLLVDLMGQVHEELLRVVIDDDDLISNPALVKALDSLVEGITSVRVEVAEVEHESTTSSTTKSSSGVSLKLGATSGLELKGDHEVGAEASGRNREVRQGPERIRLNFSEVGQAFRRFSAGLAGRRLWLLLDEWSSVPPAIQPLLGEFLLRCVLPLPSFTVKIAAIEQQSMFRGTLKDGSSVGLELGADVTANINLDDFMVFEQNEERARDFFRDLLTAHLSSDPLPAGELEKPGGLVAQGFKDRRAFDELVRASEGVPRDAINIAAAAGLRAADQKISVADVRSDAKQCFNSDNEAAIRSKDEATFLLRWIIDKVIRGKRSRGFLVNQDEARHPLLLALFDARVLHVVRRGYSAQDEPGERFDVWVIDYGAYVDLISTQYEPRGLLSLGSDDQPEWVSVPRQDLRAIRRAVLELAPFGEELEQRMTGSSRPQDPKGP